jgi:hypothetical protein
MKRYPFEQDCRSLNINLVPWKDSGDTHMLMNGKKDVLSEVYLLFVIYNLWRSVSILGQEELKNRLKALVTLILKGILANRPLLIHSLVTFRLAI